jgi:hypothetical protein
MPFNIYNAGLDTDIGVYERPPITGQSLGFMYKTDGEGNASANTGFFMAFKQGRLNNLDFSVVESLPNRLVSLNVDNINNADLWLYEVNDAGAYVEDWTKVDQLRDSNVIYNNIVESNRKVDQDNLFLLDSGGQYLDGTTDVTRTVAVGTPSAEMKDRFTRVLKGHIALSRVRFPKGTTGSALDALARMSLWEGGFDYDHGTGHGVGSYLGVHEGPHRIAKVPNHVALEPGMIVSNEPGFYKIDGYGIRTENLQYVTPATPIEGGERPMLGFETLTLAPIDRRLIVKEMLTEAELAWLNTYHAKVLAEIGPRVEADVRAWLEAATAPL